MLVAGAVTLTVAPLVGRADVGMGESMDFPHAGLALAAPAGYQSQAVSQPLDITRAILSENGKPVQAVTVSALPLDDPNAGPEELADDMVAFHQQNLVIRNLQVLSKAAMEVAGLPGAARFVSYTFRGEETVAASVVFCRPLPDNKGRLQYVITVEAAADRKAEVLPTLGAVVKSVRLLTFVRPIDIPPKDPGQLLQAPGGLYAIRLPHGWFAPRLDKIGANMGQTDYLLAGETTLGARVLVSEPPPGTTLQQHADQCIQSAKQATAQQNTEINVVSQGPSRLGGVEAYQLVLEQRVPSAASAPTTTAAESQPDTARPVAVPGTATTTTTAAAAPPEPSNVVIVQRSVLLPPAWGSEAATNPAEAHENPKCLSLVLVCVDARPAAAEAIMEKLAGGMVIRTAAKATSSPASEPTTATAPVEAAGAPK
jgi:hypothetical protein